MPGYYDDIDIQFNWCGDFILDAGDLKITSGDGLQSLLDQIHSILASEFDDWEIYPNRGANLDDFVGEPNTKSTGTRIEERIYISLVGAELVDPDDIKVSVFPVHAHRVLVIIQIQALPTPFNQLESGKILQTGLVFDTVEREMFFMDQVPDYTY